MDTTDIRIALDKLIGHNCSYKGQVRHLLSYKISKPGKCVHLTFKSYPQPTTIKFEFIEDFFKRYQRMDHRIDKKINTGAVLDKKPKTYVNVKLPKDYAKTKPKTTKSSAAAAEVIPDEPLTIIPVGVHTPSTIIIYVTRDYSIFKSINGNRSLDKRKIARIKGDIKSGLDMLKYVPIIVDEEMSIIDGQHRFELARELGRPVYYVVAREFTLNEIAKVNSNQEKWKVKDFIHCYTTRGIKDYIALDEFISKYKIQFSCALQLLRNGYLKDSGASHEIKKEFERGEFKANKIEDAIILMEDVVKFRKFINYNSRAFIVAILNIKKSGKINIDDLVRKFNMHPDELKLQVGYKNYLLNLEAVYNFKNRTREPIY